MQALYAELWSNCSREMQAFVILHLLNGDDEEDEPWCILVLHGVQTEDEVIQALHQDCSCVQSVRQCFVTDLPFTVRNTVQPRISLVACF